MLFSNIVRRTASLVKCLLIVIALLFVAVNCSSDSTGPVSSFTEGLRFVLIVDGAWSADQSDPRGRTQGKVRVSASDKSQIWLGSDAMTHIGDTPEDERYRTTVRFADLDSGVVVVRITFQQSDESTGKEIITTLKEIATFGDQPIEIKAGKITDIGTVEVAIP